VQRGEIWWAELPTPRASEPGYRRPVLIVQSDAFNQSRIHTVVVVALTSNLRLAPAPGNIVLKKRAARVGKDSVVNVSQLLTLDRSFLTDRVTTLSPATMTLVEDGIRLVLGL
jgi:mRNA interferase MazF